MSTHLAAADPAVSSPPPAASAAGGWGNAGSRCVYSVGLARCSAGGVGRAVALSVWWCCFAGGDLPPRRRRSGGALAWICYLRRPRSSGQLPWAASPRRRLKTTIPAFDLDAARVDARSRRDRWCRMEIFGFRVPATSRPPGDISRSKVKVAMRRRRAVGAFCVSSVASHYR